MSDMKITIEAAITKMSLAPGDILVLKVDEHITHAVAHTIKSHAESVIPEGIKCLVLGKGFELSVLTRAQVEALAA